MKHNTTKINERKTEITTLELTLMIALWSAVSFACGYYLASAQIAAMLYN